jgi:Na+-driven multidrug efflux pump
MNIVLEESLRGLGEPSIVFWGEAVGLVVTAGMLVALLRPMGIMGAGIASVLGYASSGLVLLSGVRRRTHHSLAEVLVLNSFDLKRILEKFAALRTSPQSEI